MKRILLAAVAAMGIGGAAQAATVMVEYRSQVNHGYGWFEFEAEYDYKLATITRLIDFSAYTYSPGDVSGVNYDSGSITIDLNAMTYSFGTGSGLTYDPYSGYGEWVWAPPFRDSGLLDPRDITISTIASVPLPASGILLLMGVAGLGLTRTHRRQAVSSASALTA